MKNILSLVLLMVIFCSKAQITSFYEKNLIWLELTLTLQDSIKQNQKYIVVIENKSNDEVIGIRSNSNPQIGLKYNSVYELIFTCDKCNTKIIEVDTNAPYDNWHLLAEVKLQKPDSIVSKVGKIFYSEKEKNFTKEKY